MRYLKFSIGFCGLIFLASCTAMKKLDKSDEYKTAAECGKPLVLPKNMKSATIEKHYRVPKVDTNHPIGVPVLPPESNFTE